MLNRDRSNAVSVSYAAVELAKKVFGNLNKKNVLVLGAGKMGELAIKNLQGSGATQITSSTARSKKLKHLPVRIDGQAKTLQELQCSLVEADILISSTGSKDFVLSKETMAMWSA